MAAWALNDVLSESIKFAVNCLLLSAWSIPELIYRAKRGKWPGINHPVGYMPLLGWLAASCVWFFPAMRADYLPPSRAIDGGLIVLAAIFLIGVLRGMARKPAD